MFARSLTAALALTFAAAPVALFASNAKYEPVTVTIEVADLDPARPDDQARFEMRLKNAARSACATGVNNRWAKAEEQRCAEEVISNGASWAN